MQCCLKFKKQEPTHSSQEKSLFYIYIYIYIYIIFQSITPLPKAQVFYPKINIKTHLLHVTDSDFSFLSLSLSLLIFLLHNEHDYESQAPLQPKSRSCEGKLFSAKEWSQVSQRTRLTVQTSSDDEQIDYHFFFKYLKKICYRPINPCPVLKPMQFDRNSCGFQQKSNFQFYKFKKPDCRTIFG